MANPKPSGGSSTKFSSENQPEKRGRPKGTRDKFSADFIADFAAVWGEMGKPAIYAVALFDTPTFVKVAAALQPKEVQITTPESSLSDEQVEEFYQLMAARLAERVEKTPDKTVN